MARPQGNRDTIREDLVDAMTALIEERGSAAFTVGELASRAGMSSANIYRYFENKDAMLDAVAERWFRPKIAIMDEVIVSDLPPRRKLYEFIARRFALMKQQWEQDPLIFALYADLGREHFEQIRSYIDLADHYTAQIIGEAMGEGFFAGLSVDEALSLVNQMLSAYVNVGAMEHTMPRLSLDKLAKIVDAIFDGLSAQDRGARCVTGLRAA